jgi:hypothetical protein
LLPDPFTPTSNGTRSHELDPTGGGTLGYKVSEQQRAAPRGGANGLESHQTVQTVTLEQVMRLGGPGITVKAIAHTFI